MLINTNLIQVSQVVVTADNQEFLNRYKCKLILGALFFATDFKCYANFDRYLNMRFFYLIQLSINQLELAKLEQFESS